MRYLKPIDIDTNFDGEASFVVGDYETFRNRWPMMTKAESFEWSKVDGCQWTFDEAIEVTQYKMPVLYIKNSMRDLLELVSWKLHVEEKIIDCRFCVFATLELIGHSDNIMMARLCLP